MKTEPDFVDQTDTDFIIQDNILKSKEVPLSMEYTNIGKLLLDRMKAKPDLVGQISNDLYELIARIEANDVVAVCVPNIMDSFAPFFVIFCVGAIFTPWNSTMDIRQSPLIFNPSEFLLNMIISSNEFLSDDYNTKGILFWLSPYFWMSGVLLTLNSIVNYHSRLLYPTFEEEMMCKIIEKYKINLETITISKLNLSGAIFTAKTQIKLKECFPKMTEFYDIITAQKSHHKADNVETVGKNTQIKIVDLKTRCALGNKYRGNQISPSEIENLLQTHPDVVEIAVVGIPHILDDEHPIAFVIKVLGNRMRASKISSKKYNGFLSFTRWCEIFRKNTIHTASKKISRKDLNVIAKSYQHTSNFITKDNIWKGIEKPISLKYTNIGKLLLDRMKAKPDFVGQLKESLVDSLIETTKLENHDIKIVVFGKASNAIPFSKILRGHRKCDVNNFECTSVDNVHDTAIIAYSSGTTGFPKGVQIFYYSCLYTVFSENLGVCNIPYG
ncbi:hypothetical protein HZH68_013019 [Vespula germanica]|uniref:AMP-binding enzyme C-terminal domain-containing protein n=1 Tax=Vespula germanica TaxID=30212 RepID=A0A834JHP1_VESGE|nr:hypothetical protein HZH68_013019 [Vespula germanica]